MKKLLMTAAAVFAFGFANAQENYKKAGINLGLPIGDIKESVSFVGGVDGSYTWGISDKFNAGFTVGYLTYLAKTVEIGGNSYKGENANFFTFGGTAQYSLTENIFVGTDLGLGLKGGNSREGSSGSGFYYLPKVGYQTEQFEIYTGYRGLSINSATAASITLGFNYKF